MSDWRSGTYRCLVNLNLYDAPDLMQLATQAAVGRQLRIGSEPTEGNGISVCLWEDNYPGWLAKADLQDLEPVVTPYQPVVLTYSEIQACLPQVIAFTHAAMAQPNTYLWGGTVGPNYDCSGLMQAAFASQGIWIPRDAYQQEGFVQPVQFAALQPGDLVFFGNPTKATHVGLYLGDNRYIHSSGKDQGRNGIGIDMLSEAGDQVSRTYWQQYRGAGRVVRSFG